MKSIFKMSFIISVFACSNLLSSCSTEKKEKPNFIFILTDDQRWDAMGYAGNEVIHTPEMDKLASQGTYFSQAMVTTPICAASRASIFTGLYERTHKFDFQTGNIKNQYMQSAYPKVLRDNGYYTAFYGKFGVKYDSLNVQFDEYEEYDRGNFGDRRSYYYKTIGEDSVHLTRYTGQQGIDFIENAPADKPFCLQLCFSAPHAADETEEQYFWQSTTDHLFQGMEMAPAKISEDKYFEALPEEVRNGFNRLRWTWRYDTPEKYQHSVKGYYRMIAGIDLEIGKLRETLKKKGLDKNTVIILMGDNGYFLGERQLAGKWLMYDNSLRVPLVILDPRQNTHHDISGMALNIDVPATILDMAGVQMPSTWQGKSLYPYVSGKAAEVQRDTALFEHLWDFDNIPPSEGIRTNSMKYMRYVNNKSIEELYDLEKDPLEIDNLINDPAHQQALETLRNKCDELGETLSDSLSQGPTDILLSEEGNFSWTVPTTAESQKGYQVLVASSLEKLNKNIGDLMDSGHVKSDKSDEINFEGTKVDKNQPCYWKVRIWDVDNRLTRYSKPQEVIASKNW